MSDESKSLPIAEGAPQEPKAIPKDLQDQLNSIKAIASCFNLLQQAPFPFGFNIAVDQSLKFLQSLHEQMVTAAKSHPDSNLVPELKEVQ